VERKQRYRLSSDVSPEQGSSIYEPEICDEITKTFQQDEFFFASFTTRRWKNFRYEKFLNKKHSYATYTLQKDCNTLTSLLDMQKFIRCTFQARGRAR
jgi:hypothetical protein